MSRAAVLTALAGLAIAGSALAASPAPWPALSGLGFLVGDWIGDRAPLPETGGTAGGRSRISVEAGGAALLRRDHTDLFGKDGKRTGGLDQIMLIYAENGAVHADYFDGGHVIHYVNTEIKPGSSAVFTSAVAPGAPVYRLSYVAAEPAAIQVTFAIQPPGSTEFKPIAQGRMRKRL